MYTERDIGRGPRAAGTHGDAAPDRSRRPATDVEHRLFVLLAQLPQDHPRRSPVRAELVQRHQGLVAAMARRYRDRGEPLEDLVQTGNVGLIKAIDGFDLSRGNSFTTYATPMILGEIKRHFRDHGWAVHITRRVQNLKLMVHRATNELIQRLGRPPTPAELAEHLQLDEDEVVEGMQADTAYGTLSLDAFEVRCGDHPALPQITEDDHNLDLITTRESIWPLLGELPEQERQILLLRFYGNMSQNEVASRLGLSQAHISRLQTKACARLRDELSAA